MQFEAAGSFYCICFPCIGQISKFLPAGGTSQARFVLKQIAFFNDKQQINVVVLWIHVAICQVETS